MIKELLIEVEKVSGLTIQTRGDCEFLSSLILQETDQFISYNTLRRLFGLARAGKPRRQTLDTLAQFCGFKNYSEYCGAQPKLNRWKQRERLYNVIADKSTPGVIAFFNELENDLMKLELLLVVLREAYISSNDHLIMALLDSDAYQLQSQPYTYQIHVAIAMGLAIREQPLEKHAKLLSQPRVVDAVFLRLIDYSALNGYYGQWISMLSRKKTSNECQVFIACLRRFIAFLNRQKIEPLEFESQNLRALPPPLRGRIFAMQTLEPNPLPFDSIWFQLFNSLDKADLELSAFIEPSTFAILSGNQSLTAWLLEKVEINESTLQQFQLHDLHVHFLLQAMHAIFDGQMKKAEFWMSRFDENELRRPSFAAMLMFPIRRVEAELNGTADIYPIEVETIVEKLGHSWFCEELWTNFFESKSPKTSS